MKHIHIIPTDKPSRFYNNNKGEYHFREHYVPDVIETCKNHNIYITSDEQIKQGDFVTNGKYVSQAINEWWTKFYIGNSELKVDYWKIVLTTDQQLIIDGVEPITDDYLLYVVKKLNSEGIFDKIVKE